MQTKIISTIGPASLEKLEKLQKAGSDFFRLNLSHGDETWHRETIKKIQKLKKIPKIILDTKGPDIRTGKIDGEKQIKKGELLTLFYGDTGEKKSSSSEIVVDYELYKKVKKGSEISLDSGQITLTVEKVEGEKVFAKALNSGILTSKRHVNLPGTRVDSPILTESDKEILKMGIKLGADAIAVSFVRDKKDLEEVKKISGKAKVISKIECLEALKNIEEIIENSDQIMVARGDLGIEIPFFKVPLIEQRLIKKCQRAGKPVIVATQMLMSMTKTPFPSRAEVVDTAVATQLGANFLMLSDETASGLYPVESIEAMKKIIEFTEENEELLV